MPAAKKKSETKKHPRPEIGHIAEPLRSLAVPLSELTLDPANARKHPEPNLKGIAASLRVYGQRKPIVVNKRNGVIEAGNGTVEAAQTLGWSHVAVVYVDDDPVTAAGFSIADNRTAELAEWDEDALGKLLEELDTGDADLNEMLAELAVAERINLGANDPGAGGDEFDCTPQDGPTRCKEGDLWVIGGVHRLLVGDCTVKENVERLMGGEKAVLMATDPPYGVDFSGAKYNPRAKEWDGIANDELQGGDLEAFLAGMFAAWLPFMDEQSAFYFWTAAMAEGAAAAAAIRKAGLHIQSQIIWNKNCLVLGQADYHWKHENCWYAFFKGKKHRWFGERDKTTVWDVSKLANASYEHPMQKPTELYSIPMRHHTNDGEIVAEPFAGSGSQYIAAHRLGRRCYGCEISPRYCDVVLNRCIAEGMTVERA